MPICMQRSFINSYLRNVGLRGYRADAGRFWQGESARQGPSAAGEGKHGAGENKD